MYFICFIYMINQNIYENKPVPIQTFFRNKFRNFVLAMKTMWKVFKNLSETHHLFQITLKKRERRDQRVMSDYMVWCLCISSISTGIKKLNEVEVMIIKILEICFKTWLMSIFAVKLQIKSFIFKIKILLKIFF
jgi:hypothetical protein